LRRYTYLTDLNTVNLTVSKTVAQDPHPMVRRHALLLLSRLLLQDFLKWRGLLLFRFLACLADGDPQVAQVRVTLHINYYFTAIKHVIL
jgi:condensin-2 complex subunit D3